MSALDEQVGGCHYKDMPIQPAVYNYRNGLGFIEGCVVKYVSRWNRDGGAGVKDLAKAKHFLEMLIEMKGKALERPLTEDARETASLVGVYQPLVSKCICGVTPILSYRGAGDPLLMGEPPHAAIVCPACGTWARSSKPSREESIGRLVDAWNKAAPSP